MKRAYWLGLVAALATTGCPADEDPEQDSGTSSATETGEDATTTTAPPTTTVAGSESTAQADSTTGPTGPIPASGIHVDWVEANQAIGVRIGEDGGEVGPEGRTASLLANRIALVRAFWTIDDDWEPREIEAHFTVNFPDGTSDTKIDTKMVEGDSFIGSLSESFFWGLLAEEAIPGITYHIELFETDAAFADPSVTEPPRLPEDGSEAFVGIEDSYQVMKVVLVPFNYDDEDGCVTQPDTSEETMQLFEDYLYMMNPVDRLEIEIHESIDWDGPLESFVPLNSYMSEMRFLEEAPAETYYYGYVDVCSGGLGGAGGLAHGIPSDPTSPDAAYQRVSSGLSLNPEFSAETFVHEIGHSQGRRHVACSGEEGGPDITYPIEGGDLGEWGFGVLDFQLRHPTVYKDYMTYCNPAWVSTWGWNKVYPVVRALSMWDADFPGGDVAPRPSPTAEGRVLVGTVEPSGAEHWYTVPGGVKAADLSRDVEIEVESASGKTRLPTYVSELPDGDGGRVIVVPLPAEDAFTGLARIEGSTRTAIDTKALRGRHRAH